jgi:hypothetical protein
MHAQLRQSSIVRAAVAAVIGIAAAACSADPPSFNDPPDAGGSGGPGGIRLEPPAVAAAETTPNASAAVRGTAPGASLVVVQTGGANNVVARVLPDGSFCADVPLAVGANTLRVTVLAQGNRSQETVTVVVRDPGATPPAQATCNPPPPPGGGCSDAQAMCDPACNGCAEDAYQPNFAPGQAPALGMKRAYQKLQLCPCHPDWFTFVAHPNQSIGITATYAKASGFDLDIALYRGGDVLPTMGSAAPVAASAAGTSGSNATRTITFTAASTGGAYYLRVSAPTGTTSLGSYELTMK